MTTPSLGWVAVTGALLLVASQVMQAWAGPDAERRTPIVIRNGEL